MLHAITEDRPLAEIDNATLMPVDDLKWKGNTPHPEKRTDNKITTETL